MLIFIHGLGQNAESWKEVTKSFSGENFETPNLFEFSKNQELTFDELYKKFSEFCEKYEESLNLCGLSLGGTLALRYAIENPKKVKKLMVIAPIFKIPKNIFKIQLAIFKLLPKKLFTKMHLPPKKLTLSLLKSMLDLNLKNELKNITAETVILCGEKDMTNKSQCKKLNDILSNSCLVFAENSAHEVNIENPEAISKNLKNLLNKESV